jgi:quinol monooxygenase YgiN
MKKQLILSSLFFVLLTSLVIVSYAQEAKPLIVLVKYKALPGKEKEALSALKSLVDKVKKEPHYESILIHVDPQDASNILLYEQWANDVYYKGEHMQTPQLQQFMQDSRTFLGGPPDISFWNIAS